MLKQHLTITDDFQTPTNPIIDDVEASALKAKAQELWTTHQAKRREGVSDGDAARWQWTSMDVANAFVHVYGGKITEYRAEYPWVLLYCRNNRFVAYIKRYKLEGGPRKGS